MSVYWIMLGSRNGFGYICTYIHWQFCPRRQGVEMSGCLFQTNTIIQLVYSQNIHFTLKHKLFHISPKSTKLDKRDSVLFIFKGDALLLMEDRQLFTKRNYDASSTLLRPWNLQYDIFHLASPPCTHRNTPVIAVCYPWIKVLRETRKPLYKKHLRISLLPQWRPSGTGNSLLCIAVILCRSISAPQRRTHCFFSPSPDIRVIHAPTCDVVLTFEAQIGKFSMHCPHGTPGPGPQHPPAHPSERPVQLNFSIGGKWKSDAFGWEPRFACDWSKRGCWWEGNRHHADRDSTTLRGETNNYLDCTLLNKVYTKGEIPLHQFMFRIISIFSFKRRGKCKDTAVPRSTQ